MNESLFEKKMTELTHGIKIPQFIRIHQNAEIRQLTNPCKQLRDQITANPGYTTIKPNDRVAIAVGSRNIYRLADYINVIVECIKNRGGIPYIIAAMGSHGGNTIDGQIEILKHFGITQDNCGCEIYASTSTRQLEYDIWLNNLVFDADHLILINRIHPHTSFRGDYESGLAKLLAVGLGNREGAYYLHSLGMDNMSMNIRNSAERIIKQINIAFAIGIIENSIGKTFCMSVISKEDIMSIEPEMLKIAKKFCLKLPFDHCDVCIIDEIGKDICGSGYDGMVIQNTDPQRINGSTFASRIGIMSLSPLSNSAHGIGRADFIHKRVLDRIDYFETYINSITTLHPSSARIPMALLSDEQIIKTGIYTSNRLYDMATILHIRNTTSISTVEVSMNLLDKCSSFDVDTQKLRKLEFDLNGNFKYLEQGEIDSYWGDSLYSP